MAPPGWVGIGTPQGNPTVEMEMRRLLPEDVEPLTTRLVSDADTSDERLVEYLEHLPTYLKRFDNLPLDVFGFACTGSSYLLGAAREAKIVAETSGAFGYPVITAADAVRRKLDALGARRIALLAPYPQHLVDAAKTYWETVGLTVTAIRRIDLGSMDTRLIYGLGSADAAEALESFDPGDADAILISGTGMPTLKALAPAEERFARTVVSSNQSLAWALTEALDHAD